MNMNDDTPDTVPGDAPNDVTPPPTVDDGNADIPMSAMEYCALRSRYDHRPELLGAFFASCKQHQPSDNMITATEWTKRFNDFCGEKQTPHGV